MYPFLTKYHHDGFAAPGPLSILNEPGSKPSPKFGKLRIVEPVL